MRDRIDQRLRLLFELLALKDLSLQRFIGCGKFSGSFLDFLFEFFVESLYFRLGLLQLGNLDYFPASLPPGHSYLMDVRHIENLITWTRGERVGAQYDAPLIRDHRIDLFFIFAKDHPVIVLNPAPISRRSQSGVALRQRLVKFFAPGLKDSLRIPPFVAEIPFIVAMDFEGSLRKMALEIGNRLPQCMLCFFHAKSLRNHPEAKLFALEARFEIQHLRFEQILLCLVEVTEMCSPAHVPDDADACFSQLGRRRPITLRSGEHILIEYNRHSSHRSLEQLHFIEKTFVVHGSASNRHQDNRVRPREPVTRSASSIVQ